jgi:hypothetical protein
MKADREQRELEARPAQPGDEPGDAENEPVDAEIVDDDE